MGLMFRSLTMRRIDSWWMLWCERRGQCHERNVWQQEVTCNDGTSLLPRWGGGWNVAVLSVWTRIIDLAPCWRREGSGGALLCVTALPNRTFIASSIFFMLILLSSSLNIADRALPILESDYALLALAGDVTTPLRASESVNLQQKVKTCLRLSRLSRAGS